MIKSSVTDVNGLSAQGFVDRFGFLFEHSPWIVAEAADARPFVDAADMFECLIGVFMAASPDHQLAVLRAHPKLADKAAVAIGLTTQSAAEQASAGLDSLTPEEFARFHLINQAYEARFGFPFIICVREAGGKAAILAAMDARMNNSAETEFATALHEVSRIVYLRLMDAVSA